MLSGARLGAYEGALAFRSSGTTSGDLDTALDAIAFGNPGTQPPLPKPATLALTGFGVAVAAAARRRLLRR
jgi:hypothetical protein